MRFMKVRCPWLLLGRAGREWSYFDTTDRDLPARVGPLYKTKTEALADGPRYWRETWGWPDSVLPVRNAAKLAEAYHVLLDKASRADMAAAGLATPTSSTATFMRRALRFRDAAERVHRKLARIAV